MKKEMFVMVGCPACGKSTWVREVGMKQDSDIKTYISRDEVRFSLLKEGDAYFSKEKEVFKIFIDKIKEALIDTHIKNIFVDATHLNSFSRTKLLRALGQSTKGVELSALYIKEPLETCIERNNNRKGTKYYVPEEQLIKMYNSITPPDLEEGFDNIIIKDNGIYTERSKR